MNILKTEKLLPLHDKNIKVKLGNNKFAGYKIVINYNKYTLNWGMYIYSLSYARLLH